METKFTQKKKLFNSMFNIKISCLMKRKLNYLMMVVAIMVLAATSAMAQADGSPTNPYVHANGSTHNLTVTGGGGVSTFLWTWDATTAAALTGTANETTNVLQITWSEDAAGSFYFDVTETYTANATQMACQATTRRVYIYLIKMDVHVYISDENGTQLTGDELLACGTGTTATFGDEGPGAAFSNRFNTDGNLLTYDPGTNQTPRYIGLEVNWITGELPGVSSFVAPDITNLTFTYTVAGVDIDDFASLEATATTTGTVTVAEVSENVFVADLLWNPRWGKDIVYNVTATDCIALNGATVVGMERSTTEAGVGSTDPWANTTADETILGSPATSDITTD